MSCESLVGANPRISGRSGKVIDLNIDFYNNGVLADPFAIRFVEIYHTQVLPHNLIATVPVVDIDSDLYPSPVCQDTDEAGIGDCGTVPDPGASVAGRYHLPYIIPEDVQVPNVFFDVWYYFTENPCEASSGTDCDVDNSIYDAQLLKCCHRFFAYPDEWFCNDGLQSVRFAFEPLDQKFNSPEVRPLEVGLMPLPLYDYNFNLVNPLIPYLNPTITIETRNNELLVDRQACTIGLRHGSYRSNPYVVKYNLNTALFLKGTYQYYITLNFPDGSSRVSKKFILTIS